MTDGIYLLLGSNIGDKKKHLSDAKALLERFVGKLLAESGIYETAAWGKTDQDSFYNQVIRIETLLSPGSLLFEINRIESELGRVRLEKWAERIIDIDILYYNDLIINDPDLTIPHFGIPHRRFTLVPLVEIAARFIHPKLGIDQSLLLKACKDDLEVVLMDKGID